LNSKDTEYFSTNKDFLHKKTKKEEKRLHSFLFLSEND